jgi:hypothetical protein
MNKTILRTLLICIAIPVGLFFISFLLNPSANDALLVLGLILFLAGLVYIIPGIILALVKDDRTRNVGKGMLLSVALLLLVGFSVCSTQPISFQ